MILKSKKLQPLLASFCALGWSLAYPLIKLGYSEIGISSSDTGSKIMFASIILKEPFMWQYILAGLIVASGIYVINNDGVVK